jgi:hypothetical protein
MRSTSRTYNLGGSVLSLTMSSPSSKKRKRNRKSKCQPDAKTKECSTCHLEQPIENFTIQRNTRSGYKSACKSCASNSKRLGSHKPANFIAQMIRHGIGEDRAKNRVPLPGEAYLTSEEVLEMAETGCYYSGRPVKFYPDGGDQASLDRLDNVRPHVSNNVVLCQLRFNTANRWTREKYVHMMNGADIPLSEDEIKQSMAVCKKTYKKNESLYNDGGQLQCVQCELYFDTDTYLQNQHHRGCKDCRAACERARQGTVIGALSALLSKAKSRGRRDERKKCTLTLQDLIELYMKQQGLCKYSSLRLRSSIGDWKMSLERIDPRKKYCIDNVVLIVQELNCIDNTIKREDDLRLNGGWSKEIVEQYRHDWLNKCV